MYKEEIIYCCSFDIVMPVCSLKTTFFLVRKIGPELTSVANLPLFGEEDQPSANIRAHLPLLYVCDAATAWLDERCIGPCPGSEPANLGPPKQRAQT